MSIFDPLVFALVLMSAVAALGVYILIRGLDEMLSEIEEEERNYDKHK